MVITVGPGCAESDVYTGMCLFIVSARFVGWSRSSQPRSPTISDDWNVGRSRYDCIVCKYTTVLAQGCVAYEVEGGGCQRIV